MNEEEKEIKVVEIVKKIKISPLQLVLWTAAIVGFISAVKEISTYFGIFKKG